MPNPMPANLLKPAVFLIGLAALCWIGAGYVGTHALALAVTGVVLTRTEAAGADPFSAVLVVAVTCAALSVVAAARTTPRVGSF